MASHLPTSTRRLGSPSILLSTPELGCFCGHPCSEASQTLGRPTSAHSTQEVLSGQKERVYFWAKLSRFAQFPWEPPIARFHQQSPKQ